MGGGDRLESDPVQSRFISKAHKHINGNMADLDAALDAALGFYDESSSPEKEHSHAA